MAVPVSPGELQVPRAGYLLATCTAVLLLAMIGTSFTQYVFIRTSIAALRAITPLSIAYIGFCLFKPPRSILARGIAAWAAAESLFYLGIYLPRKSFLQRAASHPDLLRPQHRELLFQRCLRTVTNPEAYLSKWFLDSPLVDVKRENVKDFFRWAFLNTAERNGADETELDVRVDELEELLGKKIEPGRGSASCLRLTVDSVDMMHRPLFWYMIVGFVDTGTATYLSFRGFQFHCSPLNRMFHVFPLRPFSIFARHRSPSPEIPYWYRPHKSKASLPILFIHGIGIGLYPYVKFLAELKSQDEDTGIIAIEILPVSFRITSPVLAKEAMCRQIVSIIQHHGWDKIVLAAHSYGTVVATHLLHDPETAPKIGPVLLVDPVSFLLHLPDVAYNFTARRPRRANEHQLYYFASKDMGVAHTLARHFFWSENVLWKEDLHDRPVTVSLAGRDLIVDTAAVAGYLRGDGLGDEEVAWAGLGLDVLWFQQCDHAQVFEHRLTRRKLIDVLVAYTGMQRPAEAV